MTVGGVTTDYAYDGTMLVREFQINQQTGLLAPSVTYMVARAAGSAHAGSRQLYRIRDNPACSRSCPCGMTSILV